MDDTSMERADVAATEQAMEGEPGQVEELAEIKEELTGLLQKETGEYRSVYRLLNDVKERELYKQEGMRSFTQWVKNFAAHDAKVAESLVWRMYRAGEVWQTAIDYRASRGADTEALESATLYAEQLALIDSVARNDLGRRDELIGRLASGKLTTTALRSMAKASVASRRRGADAKGGEQADVQDAKAPSFSAVDVIEAISGTHERGRRFASALLEGGDVPGTSGVDDCARGADGLLAGKRPPKAKSTITTLPEFPVRTGTSRAARRIDLLLVENLTCEWHEVRLHGIEVKVDRNDLLRDEKFTEYEPFVDYSYLAVPAELEADAMDMLPDGWGLILVATPTADDDGDGGGHEAEATATVVVRPSRRGGDPAYIHMSLMTVAIKLGKLA